MKYELCIACDHCDPSNTNDRQQVFCEKNPPYVDPFNGCDEFKNKALDEYFKNIGKSELTDKEIIKALECCSTYGGSCKDCPAFVKVDRSKCREVLTGAKDLINRKQAKIDSLRARCENTQIGYNFAKDEIRKLTKDKFKLQKALNQSEDYRAIAKAEAIKEFAERFKQEINLPLSAKKVFDNLVQEMAGDSQ